MFSPGNTKLKHQPKTQRFCSPEADKQEKGEITKQCNERYRLRVPKEGICNTKWKATDFPVKGTSELNPEE